MTRLGLTIVAVCLSAALAAGVFLFAQTSLFAQATLRSSPDAVPPSNDELPPDELLTYVDGEFGFTFQYPSSATVYPYWDDDTYMIAIERPAEADGFQIAVTAFSDPGPLTAERVRADLPELPMRDIVYIELFGLDDTILSFRSDAPVSNDVRETWFIYDGNLYQASTFGQRDGLMREVLTSLRFGTPWPGRL